MYQKQPVIRTTIIVFASLFALLLLLIFPAMPASASATIVGVDANNGNSGQYISIRLNSSGFAVVAYYAEQDQDLRVAVCNDANCTNPTITIVDSTGNVGSYTSLELNSSGNPVISYRDVTNADLKVAVCGNATCTSGNTLTTVDSAGIVGSYTSLELNSSGNPVISYSDSSNSDLKVAVCGNATCTSGNTLTTVDSTGIVGQYTSLELNSSGNPVISYYDNSNTALKVAVCGNATCASGNTLVQVDNTGSVGWDNSLAINASGNPVISYYDDTNFDLKVAVCGNATCSSGNTLTTVDSTGDVGWYTSLAINASGNPVISYYDISNTDVKMALCGNATCSSGNTLTTVNNTGSVGHYTSLALNSSDLPVIAYKDSSTLALTVSICSNVTCSVSIVKNIDIGHGVGQYSSITLNSSGNPVISYYDSLNGDLKLAVCGDALCSSKTLTIVDSAGSVGQYSSVVLNGSGNPVISYYDVSNQDLKIAVCGNPTCTSGNTLTTIDSTGDVGWYTSVVLNSSGNPVIAYYDSSSGGLQIVVCGDTTCSSGNTINTVDGNPGVGIYATLKLNSSGNPIISYYDQTQQDLKVALCNDAVCSSPTLTAVDSTGDTGRNAVMVLNSGGNPVISYYDVTNTDLKLAVCGDPACSSGNTLSTVDSTGSVGQYTSLALNSSGNPVIAYYDVTNGNLKVVVCGDATCSSSNSLTTPDSAGDVGRFTSAKLRADGRLFVSYYDVTNTDLKLYTNDTPGILPTATPTATSTNTPTNTATPTNTNTPTMTPSATNTPVPRVDTIGVYKDGVFSLRNANSAGAADITVAFGGDASDLPVAGDWNGDGVDTIGVYRGTTGVYFLSDSNTSPTVAYNLVFGNPGDTPFAGKWTNDMTHDGVGVYRNSNGILYQKKQLITGFSDFFAIFGNPGDQGYGGDFDGSGYDSIGVYRSGNQTWYMTNNSQPSGITFSDIDFVWDISTNRPVIGDWNGDNTSTVGYFTTTGVFDLHSANASAGSDTVFAFGPASGYPIAGKWIAASRPPNMNLVIGGSYNNNQTDNGSGD